MVQVQWQRNDQLLFRAQVDGTRRAQQRRAELQGREPPLPPGHGVMAPAAQYFDIPLVEDDDFYFLGHPGDVAPFWATPRPAYFDDFEAACRGGQVARLQQITSQYYLTPAVLHHGLTLALAAGNVDAAGKMLSCGAPVAKLTPDSILSAPQDKQVALFDLLATQGWTPSFHLFMRTFPNTDLLRWFLAHGIDPNYGIKLVLPSGAREPSYECADALEAAASKGSVEDVEILIAAGAKIAYGVPLHRAAGATPPGFAFYRMHASQPEDFDRSRIAVMEALVKHGADVNQKEDTPYMSPIYPIQYAVSVGATRRARWLLDHGANPELRGPVGTAVDYALRMGTDAMKDLFQRWARPPSPTILALQT